jgi:hypothetical protein
MVNWIIAFAFPSTAKALRSFNYRRTAVRANQYFFKHLVIHSSVLKPIEAAN